MCAKIRKFCLSFSYRKIVNLRYLYTFMINVVFLLQPCFYKYLINKS